MIQIGYALIFLGLLSELSGVYFLGREYLPIRFRDFIFEPALAFLYVIVGKSYPFDLYARLRSPQPELVVKGLFFLSGGLLLQLLGTVSLFLSWVLSSS